MRTYKDIRAYWEIYAAEFRLWKLKMLSGIYENMPEFRFNPNHDPTNGRFTSGGGSSSKDLTGGEVGGIIKATKQQRKEFKDKLNGIKTPNGTIITNVYDHAADRMIERNVSAEKILEILQSDSSSVYPGNRSGRICVQKDGIRIVYSDNGDIVTAVTLD